MKFDTYGDPSRPAVVSVPGMFCTAESPLRFAKYMAEKYFIVLPTLDGHYRGSEPLISAADEAEKLVSGLRGLGVTEIAMLHGTSMGAEVALAAAKVCDIPVRAYFYDGGPFFLFPAWFRKLMEWKFRIMLSKCGKNGADALMNDGFVKKLAGDHLKSYREMISGFSEMAKIVTKRDVRVITGICYRCALPELSEKTQRKSIFHFSEGEPAHMSKKRLTRAYPYASFIDRPGNGHCGFQTEDPKGYAEMLMKVIEDA